MQKRPKAKDEPVELTMLNTEQIAARRVPLEDAEISLGKNGKWQCHYCTRRFLNETIFMRHHCEPKRRAQELSSPLGMAAYGYYREWMRMRKFSQPSSAAFLESKFYRAFINFAQMIIDANVAKPERYMEIMVAGEIQPVLWCHHSAYALYLDWSDKLSDPLDQVQSSINYLMDICEKDNVTLTGVFNHLGPQSVISLVRQRRLSPWLLFCSTKFGAFLKTLDSAHLSAFNSVVNGEYWGNRFKTERATVSSAKEIASQMGL